MKRTLVMMVAALAWAFGQPTWGQGSAGDPARDYPTKPIRVLVGFSAGSTTSWRARWDRR
jgi:hypothetical protein